MEASSITTEPAIEDEALKSLLDTFGSRFSLDDIASAFCKAGRDRDLTADILCGMQTGLASHEMHSSNGRTTSKSSLETSEGSDFQKSWSANGYRSKVSTRKVNPASVGSVSSVLGKKYVWRVAGSNGTSNETQPLIVDEIPEIRTNQSLFSKDPNLNPSGESSLSKDANLNDDIVNFLYEMLGRGFQLERSAIQEVLGSCGYDMKKSLETLLDLTATTLDQRNDIPKGGNTHSDSRTLSSRNQVPTPNIAKSNRFGSNGLKSNGRCEQQREVLTSLFHAPSRNDLAATTASDHIAGSAGGFRATRVVVSEPLEDNSSELEVNYVRPYLAYTKDEVDEDSAYHILRKAVKEHRQTMREYYKAAAEAFASGDRGRATLLLEKGQYFYNKAREADEESASKIFETHGGGEAQDDMSLDLQDHDAKEAIQLVKCHLRSLSGIPSISNLKILIGKGDERDVQKRRRLVKKLLEREAIKWDEDENLGTMLIRLDEINPKSLSFARK